MGPFGDLIVSIAASAISVAALLVVGGRLRRDRGLRGDFVTYFGVGALAALVCAVMNILEATGGGAVAAAVGNATNILAPAALWAGARRINGRSAIGALSGVASALGMLAVTFVIPLDSATLVKTAGIALFSALAGAEILRAPARTFPGARSIGVALELFAGYNVWRLGVAGFAGMRSELWDTAASANLTSLVSAVTIVAVSVGALVMGRRLVDDPAPGSRLYARRRFAEEGAELRRRHPTLVGLTLRLPELDLVRAAHGSAHADRMLAALADAAGESLPDGIAGVLSRDEVGALAPDITDEAREEIRRRLADWAQAEDTAPPELRMTRQKVSTPDELETFMTRTPPRLHLLSRRR